MKTLIVLIISNSCIVLFQIFQAIYVSHKIEKFKNELKKSEIKFSRYHNLQVDALKSIYEKLVDFQILHKDICLNTYESNNYTTYNKKLNDWLQIYINVRYQFMKKNILLPENLKILIEQSIMDFEELKNIILSEKESIDFEQIADDRDRDQMYNYEDNEIGIINRKIQELKRKDSYSKLDQQITDLKKNIEEHFRKMNE